MVDQFWFYMAGGETAGPVSDSVFLRLVEAGHLHAESLVWTIGVEAWMPLGSVGSFTGKVGAAPNGYVPETPDRVALMVIPGGRSSLATTAFHLGWLSVFLLPAPLAVVVGVAAFRDIRRVRDRTGHTASGRGKALFGMVAGTAGTLALLWFIVAVALT